MKTKSFNFLLVLLAILLGSCRTKTNPSLTEINQYLSTDLERGEKLLDSIKSNSTNLSGNDKCYLNLLEIKLRDKKYLSITEYKDRIDSLINYFNQKDDSEVLAETYYFAGRIYYELGDTPQALTYFQKAIGKTSSTNNILQADIYSQIAYIYDLCNLNTDALQALQKAYHADSLANNKREMLYDLRDIADNYYMNGNNPKAIHISNKGLNLSLEYNDTIMQKEFHHLYAEILTSQKKYLQAKFHLVKSLSYPNSVNNDKSGIYSLASKIYIGLRQREKAKKYLDWLSDSANVWGKAYAYDQNTYQAIIDGKNNAAIANFSKYKSYKDSIQKIENSESIKKAEELYNYNLKEQENEKLRATGRFRLAIIFVTVILLAFTVFVFYLIMLNVGQTRKLMKYKLDKYKSLTIISKNEYQKSNKQKEVPSIYNTNIYKDIFAKATSKTYKLSTQDWEDLKNAIISTYPYFNERLRELCTINEQDFKMCLLLKIGIRPIDIAGFTNRSKEAITSARRRLYEKAFQTKGTPQNWDKIIRSL